MKTFLKNMENVKELKKDNIRGIYKITSPSNRIYIGQSINIKNRFKNYRLLNCKEQIRLYNSLLKYGFENHKFEILEECDFEYLNIRERHYQDYYNVISNGLNCYLTETNILKKVYSEEYKNNLSIAAKKRGISDETRFKMMESRLKRNLKGSNSKLSKKIICNNTGKIWDSLNECALDLGFNKSTLGRYLCGLRKNKTTLKYINNE